LGAIVISSFPQPSGPGSSYHTLFPRAGEFLTQRDIGEVIMRVYPFKTSEGRLDWSFVRTGFAPGLKLQYIDLDQIVVKFPGGDPYTLEGKWNDGFWTTAEKIDKYIKTGGAQSPIACERERTLRNRNCEVVLDLSQKQSTPIELEPLPSQEAGDEEWNLIDLDQQSEPDNGPATVINETEWDLVDLDP